MPLRRTSRGKLAAILLLISFDRVPFSNHDTPFEQTTLLSLDLKFLYKCKVYWALIGIEMLNLIGHKEPIQHDIQETRTKSSRYPSPTENNKYILEVAREPAPSLGDKTTSYRLHQYSQYS